MTWDEFCSLLSGINSDTPLGQVVAIRSETNLETINNFSRHERKIYDDWNREKNKKIIDEEGDKAIEMITAMLKKMAKE